MAIRLERILFPTDFSESSDHAFQYALSLARQFKARLDLVHVVEALAISQHASATILHVDEIIQNLEKEAKSRLTRFLDERVPKDIRTTGTTLRGAPFLEIIRCAREKESDLVVMGTHGRTGLAHVLMGSTAEKVVRQCGCPVLTVKSPGHEFRHP